MWLNELSNLYNESWLITSPSQPGDAKGMKQPVETKDSISYRGLFGSGSGAQRNPYADGLASGQMPFEQEEDTMISKNTVLNLIGNFFKTMDNNNHLDKSAILSLAKLEMQIKGL
jgi:hypothetical protein